MLNQHYDYSITAFKHGIAINLKVDIIKPYLDLLDGNNERKN